METYSKEMIEGAKDKVKQLIDIVHNLEDMFKGRHFTLDGHLVGSIGEVMAAYYYGISLYEASTPVHDGKSPDGREVQIKMTQGDSILIGDAPDYLIALHMDRETGDIEEIYNGPGDVPFTKAYHYQKHNNRYMRVSMLYEEDKKVAESERIPMLHKINKYQINLQKVRNRNKKTTITGYVNKNQQRNLGITGKKGNLKGQMLYKMYCMNCGFEYEANGCDIWLRRCPFCQNR